MNNLEQSRNSLPPKLGRFHTPIIILLFSFPAFNQLRFLSYFSNQELFVLIITAFMVLTKSKVFAINQVYLGISSYLCLIVLVASNVNTFDSIQNIANLFRIIICLILAPMVFIYLIQSPHHALIALRTYIISFQVGVIVFFLSPPQIGFDGVTGFAGHPVIQSILTTLALLSLWVKSPKIPSFSWKEKICYSPLLIFGILQTSRITPVGMIAVALIIRILLLRSIRGFFSSGIFIILFLLTANSIETLLKNSKTFQRLYSDQTTESGVHLVNIFQQNSSQERIQSLRESAVRISEHPILGNGLDFNGQLTSIGVQPHNVLFLGLQSGGIVLLGLLLTCVLISIKISIGFFRDKDQLGLTIIYSTWFCLFTNPILSEISVLTPLFLIIAIYFSDKFFKRKNQLQTLS